MKNLNKPRICLKIQYFIQDRQNTLIERDYTSSVLGKKISPLEANSIRKMSAKLDLIEASQQLKLQAIYFMKGNNAESSLENQLYSRGVKHLSGGASKWIVGLLTP